MIDIADHALYAAKKSGRNRSVGLAAGENTIHDNLHYRITRDLKFMISNHELNVIAVQGDELIWD